MKTSDALLALAELSASQWGMVTTAQAAERGVGRLDLSRLARAGHVERVAHGVYRDSGAPSDEFEDLRAVWLSTDPARTADLRLRDLTGGVTIVGESAAWLHGVGDLPASRHEFSSPNRRQSQRPEIKYRQRELEPADLTIVRGLPVMTLERTIADLVEARTDLTLVADVLRDAVSGGTIEFDRLEELLEPLAARNGFGKNDGDALLHHLRVLAGIDMATVAAEIGSSPELSALVTSQTLAHFDRDVFSTLFTSPEMRRMTSQLEGVVARVVEPAVSRALQEAVALPVEGVDMPQLRKNLDKISAHFAAALPVQDLLRSIGREWESAFEAAGPSRIDVQRTVEPVDSATLGDGTGSDE